MRVIAILRVTLARLVLCNLTAHAPLRKDLFFETALQCDYWLLQSPPSWRFHNNDWRKSQDPRQPSRSDQLEKK